MTRIHWTPRCSGSAGPIELGETRPRLTADTGEATAGVDRVPAQRQGTDSTVRVRVPAGGVTSDCIKRGDPAARLPANGSEQTSDVDRAPAHCEGADRTIRARVPAGSGTTGSNQRGR